MDREWDLHQEKIWRLYLVENKSLKGLMEEMEKSHGFSRPKQQWIDKLKAWGCVKNLNKDGWRYVGHQAKKRKRPSSPSSVAAAGITGSEDAHGATRTERGTHVVLAGVRLSREQVEKGIRNHCPGPRLKVARYRSPSPQLPWGIPLQVYTPPPLDGIPWPQNLPWLQFRAKEEFQALISLLENVSSGQLGQTVEASSATPSNGANFLLPVSASPARVIELQRLLGITDTMLGRGSRLPHGTGSNGSSQVLALPSIIHDRLSVLMPETSPDEHLIRAESLSRQIGTHWAAMTRLELALFIFSNHLDLLAIVGNTTSKQSDRTVLQLLEGLLSLSGQRRLVTARCGNRCGEDGGVLRMIIASEAPTAVALVDRFFASAVRLKRGDLVRRLFALVEQEPPSAKSEPARNADDSCFCGIESGDKTRESLRIMRNRARKAIKDVESDNRWGDSAILPVDFALKAGDMEMVDLLLDKGARFSVPRLKRPSGSGTTLDGDGDDPEMDVADFGSSLDSAFSNLAINDPARESPLVGPDSEQTLSLRLAMPYDIVTKVYQVQRENYSEEDIITSLSLMPRNSPRGEKNGRWHPVATQMLDNLWEMEIFGDGLKSPLAVIILGIRFGHQSLVEALLESKQGVVDINATWKSPRSSGFAPVTALTEAVWAARAFKEGLEMEICRLLLDYGASADPVDNTSLSALQVAAHCGNVELASLLLENGANINYSFGSSPELLDATALSAAITRDNGEMVEFLLGKGAEMSAQDLVVLESMTSISEKWKLTKGLIPSGSGGLFSPSALLLMAARTGELELIKFLVTTGADMDYEDERGETALSLALSIGYSSLVKYFLNSDIRRYDAAALLAAATKLSAAGEHGTVFDILFQIRNRGNAWTEYLEGLALATLICLGDIERVENMLKAGVTLVGKSPRGTQGEFLFRFHFQDTMAVEVRGVGPGFRQDHNLVIPEATIIGTACFAKQPAIVRILLQYGHRPNLVDLAIAAQNLEMHVVQQLVAAMPSPILTSSGTNIDGILATLIDRGWIPFVNSLLNGLKDTINVNIPETPVRLGRMKSLHLPLQSAIIAGDMKLVSRLIDMGADLNPPLSSTFGWTGSSSSPLATAASYGNIGMVRLLIDKGADCNAPGVPLIGNTALEAAAEYGRVDILQYLLSVGGVKTTEGRHRHEYFRAIRLAKCEGHHLAAKLLREYRAWSEEDVRVFDTVEVDDYYVEETAEVATGDNEGVGYSVVDSSEIVNLDVDGLFPELFDESLGQGEWDELFDWGEFLGETSVGEFGLDATGDH